uniref:T-complex protein 1 subunit theta n=1 Tax=Eptatretus burgeri TaxID=7764 RepID=A0A8C4QRB4_EPTBU
MNKMVINHLEKLFVTNDSATMLRELEVEHPVARILVMAGNMQEQEIGDGTNLVIIFGGALLAQASELLHAGLSVPEVVSGFERACEKALELLPTLVSYSLNDERDKAEVARLLSPVLGSKQPGNESLLSKLVALACVSVLTSSGHFNVENICITKILGSSLGESDVVQGLVFKRDVETTVRAVTDAKIAIFSCPIDLANTETKGTVLLSSAAELKAFSHGEESHLDTTFSDLAAAGANVLVSGGKVSDMAIHFANKKGLMVVRLNSKWDLRRLCKAVGATALPMLTIPSPEQLGHCANVSATEIGETQVVMFKQGPNKGAISTILLRGSTENLLDDVERALDDAINTYKVLLKDKRLLPGAGATEMELARELESFGEVRMSCVIWKGLFRQKRF